MSGKPGPPRRTGERAAAWLLFSLVAAAFVGMAAFSWEKWPDVMVDFGHELYIPWQLSQGKALGRDTAAYYTCGPLSAYVNALLFRLFGPSLRVLVFANLLVLALALRLLHGILRNAAGGLGAAAGGLIFGLIFAFGQYVDIGNYNWVTPYSHGVTHGMVLSLLAIALLARFARTGAIRPLGGAGFCLGLVFLTKPEVFAACAAALGAGLLGLLWHRRGAEAARILLCIGGAALCAPLAAIALLHAQMSAAEAIEATLRPWRLARTDLVATRFYLEGLGFDRPWENLWLLVRSATVYALVLGPVALLDRRLSGAGPKYRAAAVGVALAVGAALVFGVSVDGWDDAARPLPLFTAAGCAAYAVALCRAHGRPDAAAPALAGLMLAAFSHVLLWKMLLNARFYHYGFALALPGTALLAAWLVAAIPERLARAGGGGWTFRLVALVLLAVVATAHVRGSAARYARKSIRIGSGGDAFWSDDRGQRVGELLRKLDQVAPASATLAVIPEGAMVNFLARRVNPSRYITFLPDAIAAHGEPRMLAAFAEAPPDFVAIAQRDASEHGAALFGRDYGRGLLKWIGERYELVAPIGASPFQDGDYGILLLKRRPEEKAGQTPPARP